MTQGYREFYRFTSGSLCESERIARQFVSRFPEASRAHALLAITMFHQVIMGLNAGSKELREEILREARQGMRLDPNDEFALVTLAMVLMDFFDKPSEAFSLLTRALELNPNFATAYGLLGEAHLDMGNPDEGIRYSEMSIRLNPRDPAVFFRYATLATSSFEKKDHSKTLHWANQTIALKPDYWLSYALAAASYAENGDLASAKQSASLLRQLWPEVSIARTGEAFPKTAPRWKRIDEGLIAAGIPL
jgi:adenylate cyclase